MIKKAATMLAALVTCFLTPMANAAAETIPTTAPPAIITTAPRAGDSEPIAEESPTCSPSVTFNGPTESARQFGRTDSQRGAVAARLVDQTEKSSSLGADVLKVAPSAPDDTSFATVRGNGVLQVIGQVEPQTDSLQVEFAHHSTCGAEPEVVVAPDGRSATVRVADDQPAVYVGAPWAIDETGKELPTTFTSKGASLIQTVDTSQAIGLVVFDPTYSSISCSGHWSALDAYTYLDLNTDGMAHCPVFAMLRAWAMAYNTEGGDYLPVWAHETNVANDFGPVAVKQAGGCSFSPDTGWAWDFQLPCKAHDYCYDLRRAAFSGTVSDKDCDDAFLFLMEAHCNDRVFYADCRIIRDIFYAFVRDATVVAYANPGKVKVVNRQTGKCVDVEGPSSADGAPLQQWSCLAVTNQIYRIFPGGQAGMFNFHIPFSGKCAGAVFTVGQLPCSTHRDYLDMQIRGALNIDRYSIRPRFNTGSCWRVPLSSGDGVDLQNIAPCDDTNNWYLWRIDATL